jgi:hypothetical protein
MEADSNGAANAIGTTRAAQRRRRVSEAAVEDERRPFGPVRPVAAFRARSSLG